MFRGMMGGVWDALGCTKVCAFLMSGFLLSTFSPGSPTSTIHFCVPCFRFNTHLVQHVFRTKVPFVNELVSISVSWVTSVLPRGICFDQNMNVSYSRSHTWPTLTSFVRIFADRLWNHQRSLIKTNETMNRRYLLWNHEPLLQNLCYKRCKFLWVCSIHRWNNETIKRWNFLRRTWPTSCTWSFSWAHHAVVQLQ